MDREVRGREARFLVATLSSAIQVHPDPQAREVFAAGLGVPDLYYPDRRLFLHGFGRTVGYGHWNAAGHRLAGERLAEAIRELYKGNPAPE